MVGLITCCTIYVPINRLMDIHGVVGLTRNFHRSLCISTPKTSTPAGIKEIPTCSL